MTQIGTGRVFPARVNRICRFGAVVFCGVLLSVALGADEDGAPSGDGQILPASGPETLVEALGKLPPSWQKWGEQTSGDLETLYGADSKADAQHQAAQSLHHRVTVLDKAIADARYGMISDMLRGIRGALQRRLDVIEAAWDTLSMNPEQARQFRMKTVSGNVIRAAQDVDRSMQAIPNGAAWSRYFQTEALARAASSPNANQGVFEQVQQQLKKRKTLDGPAVQSFVSRPEFGRLETAVDAYVAALNQQNRPVDTAAISKELKTLLDSLETYETSGTDASAAAARQAFDALRAIAPDGGARLSQVLQANYMNYNMRVIASEDFLNRALAQHRQEAGGVRDFFMGADIYGSQNTSTTVGIQLLPASRGARFAITLSGHVISDTQGYTRQATIYSAGNHTFYAQKEVDFVDGRFTTHPATISVNPSVMTTGASTNIRVPVLNRIADRYAVRKAEQNGPASDAHAAMRLTESVEPRFNSETDQEFARANAEFQKDRARLQGLEVLPDAQVLNTTDTTLSYVARLMPGRELGGSSSELSMPNTSGLLVQIHETLMNNHLDALHIEGKTMNEDDLRALVEARISAVTNKSFKFAAPPPAKDDDSDAKAFIFAEHDPIRVRIDNGQLILVIRAGFKREGKDDIPTQIITVPINVAVRGDQIQLTHGELEIAPADKPKSTVEQIAMAGVVRKKIESALPPRSFKRATSIQRPNGNINLTVSQIHLIDGWLNVMAD